MRRMMREAIATKCTPVVGQEPRLVAVIGTPNGAAVEDEPAVIVTRADHLPRVPRKRRSIERNKHELGSAHAISSVASSNPSHDPACQEAIWTMGNALTSLRHAATSR